jgi:hypothetical protein
MNRIAANPLMITTGGYWLMESNTAGDCLAKTGERWNPRMSRLRFSASAPWATGWRRVLCVQASGRSSGTATQLRLEISPLFRAGPLARHPLFDALGQRTIWVGPVGAGSRLKLVNNTWVAFAAEAAASSVALARRLGLDTEKVMEALAGSPLVSAWQAGQAAAHRQGRLFRPVRFVARAQGRTLRLAGGRRGPLRRPCVLG